MKVPKNLVKEVKIYLDKKSFSPKRGALANGRFYRDLYSSEFEHTSVILFWKAFCREACRGVTSHVTTQTTCSCPSFGPAHGHKQTFCIALKRRKGKNVQLSIEETNAVKIGQT